MKLNYFLWVAVIFMVSLTFVISSVVFENPTYTRNLSKPEMTPVPVRQDTRDLSKYGSLDYATHTENLSSEKDRWLINKRYDGQEWVYKSITNPHTASIGRIQDLTPPPLFPVDESVLALVGEVTAAKAFLSNDRECVYTEFTIRVDELLQDDPAKRKPRQVTADREGGVVVYPNGQRVLYESSERGLPKLGTKYLFFLSRDDESPNYRILTSYDISDGKVRQVEHGRPFDEFKNAAKTDFINIAKAKLSRRGQ